VRAHGLAGHDPDGAVRMIGIAAHVRTVTWDLASLACFTAGWRTEFVD
jgi:hypothetical protein